VCRRKGSVEGKEREIVEGERESVNWKGRGVRNRRREVKVTGWKRTNEQKG